MSSAEYAGDLLPAAHGHVRPLAAGVILLFALLQWKSMKVGSGVQNLTTILKAALFLAVVAVCFLHRATPVTAVASRAALPAGWPLFVAFIVALQAVIYTYDGWYGVVYFGGEVHNPGRDIPRAIFGTVFSVLAIYFLVNAAIVHLVSVREFAGSDFAMGIAARRVLGLAGDNFIRVVVVVGLLEQRQRDGNGHLPRALCHEPRRAFLSAVCARERRRDSGTLAVAFHRRGPVLCDVQLRARRGDSGVVFRGRLRAVVRLAVRTAPPHARTERPYRAWGYPWTTSIALAASIVFLVGALASDRENTPLTFLVLAASYPVYRALKWASRRSAARAALP